MTYEEREKRLCDNCEAKENCSYISRNLERKCTFQETTMYGWELGWQDAVDKALEWWKEELTYPSMSAEEIAWIDAKIEDFKKFMEEQQ